MDENGNYRAVDDICKYCNKTITAEQKLELLKKILYHDKKATYDPLVEGNSRKITVQNTHLGM